MMNRSVYFSGNVKQEDGSQKALSMKKRYSFSYFVMKTCLVVRIRNVIKRHFQWVPKTCFCGRENGNNFVSR